MPTNLSPERQKHLDRLLKLLALASGTSFAAEAASARAMAEELMARYNLAPGEGSKDRTKFEIEYSTPWFRGAQWEFMIAVELASLCGCKAYYRGDFERYALVGSIADIECLRYMVFEVNRQRIAAWLDYKSKGTGSDNLWSFSYAFARALEGKIEMLLEGATAITAQTEKVRLWFETGHRVRNTAYEIAGRGSSAAGRSAGNNVSLHRGSVGKSVRRIGHRR